MSTLQVRDLPQTTHQTLKVRAARAGQSLSEYVASQLEAITRTPTLDEVYDRIDQLESSPVDLGATDLVRRERDAR